MVILTKTQLFFLKVVLPFYEVYLIMDLSERLLRIARAATGKGFEEFGKLIHDGTSLLDKELEELEKKLNIDKDRSDSPPKETVKKLSQLEEDLALFSLGKGASWDEVKKAYRGEAKRYHTDKHNHDEEKKSLAHEIMLIYNSAYERLKKNYGQK